MLTVKLNRFVNMESSTIDTNREHSETNKLAHQSGNESNTNRDNCNLAKPELEDPKLHPPSTEGVKGNEVNSETFAKLNISLPMELDNECNDNGPVPSKANNISDIVIDTKETNEIKTISDVSISVDTACLRANEESDKKDGCQDLFGESKICKSDVTICLGNSEESDKMDDCGANISENDVTVSQSASAFEDNVKLDNVKIKMLARVAVSNAHFKHQQRGEPDLTLPEKIDIAQTILEANQVSFLAKFSNYLELEDLAYFSKSRKSYEIDFYCKQVEKSKSKHFSENRVKNRRYQALKELISKNEYFSDDEMKFREPYLYHEMVGQHLTDEEIQATIDKSDLKFSSILVRHIDQLNENERFSRAKDKEEGQEEEEEESDEEEMEEEEEQKTMEDEDEKLKISDEHKQELRAEFLTIMQERFLQGEDKNFDYSQVDNNEDYDDLNVLSVDAEERYFDDEDPESIHSDSNM